MYRHISAPRKGWQQLVTERGLTYPMTPTKDGKSETPYWNESAYYELSLTEVELLETVTEDLHAKCIEAARYLATGAMGDLGLPAGALKRAGESLDSDPPSLYGRFDLRYDGLEPPKMLEYNADTPTGLVEAAVTQWDWLEAVMPSCDQWNSLHDRLVAAWRDMTPKLPSRTVHFAHLESDDPTFEEWMTIAYLRDTADQAGLTTVGLTMADIGYDKAKKRFVGADEEPLAACFKIYPWEDMLREEFGRYLLEDPAQVTWLEPMWKVLLSNKALLAALWHLYPDCENLLPSHLDEPKGLTDWIAKPLHGREGEGIRVQAEDLSILPDAGRYGPEGYCYQQWSPLPSFDGNYAVLGSWVVDGSAAGLGIRESDGPVTGYYARFVPHIITEPRPDEAQVADWLRS